MKNTEVAKKHFLLAEVYQQKKNFADALENFNLCLCHAPEGSRYICPSLINRSKIYYEVKQYRKCLENLNWAQEVKVFDDGCLDLLDMVKCCEEEISLAPIQSSSMDFFKLTLPVNEKVPFVSASLELKESEIYGRYFSTTKDLNPGDVLVAEEPFYKVLESKVSHIRCCICCSTNILSLIACNKCSRVMFCSNKCRNFSIHQQECESSGEEVDTLQEKLLQRMFYQAIDVCGSIEQLKDLVSAETLEKTIMDFNFSNTTNEMNEKNYILAVTGLAKREPESADAYTKFQKILDRLIVATNVKYSNFINDYLIKCLKSLTVNFFHFFWNASIDADAKGFALCTLSAFFAHSCDPNIEKVIKPRLP